MSTPISVRDEVAVKVILILSQPLSASNSVIDYVVSSYSLSTVVYLTVRAGFLVLWSTPSEKLSWFLEGTVTPKKKQFNIVHT